MPDANVSNETFVCRWTKIDLLVYITITWTPAEHLVITSDPINSWLRVDGKKAQPIHFCKLLYYHRCF
jgi:hypothetical protein